MDFLPDQYLDLTETEHRELFLPDEPIWKVLPRLSTYLMDRLARVESWNEQGQVDPRAVVGNQVYVSPGAVIEANAVVKGPAWIGAGTVIRSGAYLREHVIIGDHCVAGNSCEFKNCIVFNRCEVSHFNYVGDSVLGFKVHLGAAVICSNFRLDHQQVKIRDGAGGLIETNLKKFGSIIGDRSEIGSNAVLNPGSIIGRDCMIYPLTSWQGILPEGHLVKSHGELSVSKRR